MPRERVKHGSAHATWSAKPSDPPKSDVSVNPTPEGPDEVTYAILSKEYFIGDPDVPSDATITEDVSLDVGWNRDAGWVQITMSIPPDKWKFLSEYFSDTDNDGVLPKVLNTGSLTRQEINAMIKTLRRARDAAFGADE